MQQVELPLIDGAVCSQPSWYGALLHTDTMFCAGYALGQKDTCEVCLASACAPLGRPTVTVISVSFEVGQKQTSVGDSHYAWWTDTGSGGLGLGLMDLHKARRNRMWPEGLVLGLNG